MKIVPEPGRSGRRRPQRQPTDLQPRLRDKIVVAALQEFAFVGFEAASVLRIATAAGVHHPHIYYYFRSKEDLWREASTQAFAPIFERVAIEGPKLLDLGPVEACEHAIRTFTRFSAENPLAALIVTRETLNPGTRLDWLTEHLLAPLHQIMVPLLEHGMAVGVFRPIPIPHFMQAMVGAVVSFFSSGPALRPLYGIDPLAPDSIDRHVDFIADLLIEGIKARPARADRI